MSTPAPLALSYVVADRIRVTPDGRIIDFVNPTTTRQNTSEERVRQGYARKLHYEYDYPKELIVIGAPINIGSETRFADIAVYYDAAAARRKDQAKIRLVVETKAADIKSGKAQLKSYIFSSCAEGGVWLNATDTPQYYRRYDKPSPELETWPNIPRAGEDWDGIGKHNKGELRPPHDLVETFKRCHNALYKVGIDSEDLAMDMVRIILAKYRDETNEGDVCEFRISPLELQSPARRKQVADRVRHLFKQVRDENPDVFDQHETITAGDREISIVVSELQEFRFLPDEQSDEIYDVVGAAYEVYVGSHLKGDRGQYFTHRLIVQLVVRLVDPDAKAVILDPAMGSGGFLVMAMRHVTQRIIRSNRSSVAKAAAITALHHRIYGVDKAPKLVKVARTNMILASDGHSGLVRGDSLETLTAPHFSEDFLTRVGIGRPTAVLTNPPFGATSEHKITAEKEPEILEQFQVGHVWRVDKLSGELRPTADLTSEGVPPEYLFLERCIQWVAPGGKIGIVLPRAILDNDKALALRTFIFRETRVIAVVNCHDDTFKPHTGAKTAIFILEKKKHSGEPDDDYRIFMAISQGIGHNGVGEAIYKTNATGDDILVNGEPVLDEDTNEIYQAWLAIERGDESPSEYYFSITRKMIGDNLNFNPVRYLPKYAESRQRVLELGESDEWTVERLGQIGQVFNGPRFKRPYADKGVTSGPKIIRYFTGNAITQTRAENLKYLDLQKAKPIQLKMINKLYLQRGMILITDSGTVGRVIYTTAYQDGAIGTNNLIRVVISDELLRGYVYQFLSSKLGQDQLKANIYGVIIDHIEPADVKNILIPIPKDPEVLKAIALPILRSMDFQEQAYIEQEISKMELAEVGGYPTNLDPELAKKIRTLRADSEPPPSSAPRAPAFELEFRALVEQWRKDTKHTSSVTKMITHPAYRRVMGMGPDALPLLFKELEDRKDHWLVALSAITGQDPVPEGQNFAEAVETWIAWGKEKGYL
jgi:type I restriction enzyme M protein